jgi:hypothetical protein
MSTQPPNSEQVPPPGEPWTEEQPESHLERADERWSLANQLRDWGILLVMILIYLTWTLTVYFFEPGIR